MVECCRTTDKRVSRIRSVSAWSKQARSNKSGGKPLFLRPGGTTILSHNGRTRRPCHHQGACSARHSRRAIETSLALRAADAQGSVARRASKCAKWLLLRSCYRCRVAARCTWSVRTPIWGSLRPMTLISCRLQVFPTRPSSLSGLPHGVEVADRAVVVEKNTPL